MNKYSLVPDVEAIEAWRAIRRDVSAGKTELLRQVAQSLRIDILEAIHEAHLGHVGGDFSVVDVLSCLYFGIARVDPSRPNWPERDRVILSKGHASVSLYATLARCGFFERASLRWFAKPQSPLNGHPNHRKVPGVEANTGPLGHGLPFAVGAAIASQLEESARHVYVVLGDGELQEGSNWEAAMFAAHRGLDRLTAVVDRNRLQQGAGTETTNALEPLADKWRSFGWSVQEIPGHDHSQILAALRERHPGRPHCLIANTTKGKGVSFMEDRQVWHHRVPSSAEFATAMAELRS